MQLSIIISTINRKIELEQLLNSIENYVKNITFEVIIIDQNAVGFLDDLLEKYKQKLDISHHVVAFRSLSKARNYGADIATGEYFSFPDDDCLLFPDTYTKSLDILKKQNIDIVFGRCIDSDGNDSVIKFNKESYKLNKKNMLGGFVEATGVIHRSIFEKGFYFDENMGAGCFHGAEEGYDWLYRILNETNIAVIYSTDVIYFHPQVLLDKGSPISIKRVFTYSCGKAYLYKKHKFYLNYFKRVFLVTFSIPVYFFISRKKAKYYFSELLGLLCGVVISK